MAAITGGVAGAFYGVPQELQEKAVAFMDERQRGIWERFKQFMAHKEARRMG